MEYFEQVAFGALRQGDGHMKFFLLETKKFKIIKNLGDYFGTRPSSDGHRMAKHRLEKKLENFQILVAKCICRRPVAAFKLKSPANSSQRE